eukprot:5500364-Pleurochrysis_carterae.AAC.1
MEGRPLFEIGSTSPVAPTYLRNMHVNCIKPMNWSDALRISCERLATRAASTSSKTPLTVATCPLLYTCTPTTVHYG